ncbi:MAG: sulfotransferase domain-containing protein [Patescibacteria group bacterium]
MSNITNFDIDFIGIGTGHAGTSWVFTCIKEHPAVCDAKKKETKFFRDHYHKGIEYYASLFSSCDDTLLKGEFTPSYMYDETIAERIHAHFPKAKIIVCLRHPYERLRSAYYFNKQRAVLSFENLNKKIQYDIEAATGTGSELIRQGNYYSFLKKYYKLFGASQIHIIYYEDIKNNPEKVIETVYKFLSIDPKYTPSSLSKKSMLLHVTNAILLVSQKLKQR